MSYDGTLRFDTKIDTAGMQQGGNKLKSIVAGLGIFELMKKSIGAVTASIGEAVARVDTLNRFPKIMQQMGYGADEAAASTQKLSDSVQGLPTSLDTIVASAQNITLLTGNLETATDTTIALNDAFLASGATVADAERGLTQYVQMLSKGSVDIVSWRTLQETMGYALRETAEAMGYVGDSAVNDLYAALKNGEVTFDQFNAKVVELDQGVGGFAELAHTASSGIGTSWTNIKTAVVRGVADVITAIDNGMASVGGISGAMDKAKVVISDGFKTVAAAIPPIIQTLKTIAPLIAGIGAAWAGWKIGKELSFLAARFSELKIKVLLFAAANTKAAVANTAQVATLKASEIAVGSMTGKIGLLTAAKALATKAQIALNAAWAANPIGIIVAAVAALTVGVIALVAATREEDEATKQLNVELEESKKKREELKESIASANAEYEESERAAKRQAQAAQDQVDKIRQLEASSDGSAAAQLRLKNAVAQLNEILPESGVQFDEVSGKVVGLTDDLDAYIDKLKETAIQEAMNKKAVAYAEAAADATISRIEAEARLQEVIDAGNYQEEMRAAKAGKTWTNYSEDYKNAKDELNKWIKAEEDAANSLDEFSDAMDYHIETLAENADAVDVNAQALAELGEAYGMAADEVEAELTRLGMTQAQWQEMQDEAIKSASKSVQEFAIEYGGSVEQIEAAIQKSGLTTEEWIAQQEDAYKRAKEALAAYTGDAVQLYNRIETQSSQSIGQVIGNLEANKSAVEQYADDLLALDGKIDAGLFTTLQEKGPEKAAATARMLASASAGELESFNAAYTNAGEAGLNAYETVFGEADTSESGEAVAESTASGIESSVAVKTAAENMIDGAHAAALTKVASLNFASIGKNMIDGIIAGVESGKGSLVAAIQAAVAAAHAEAKRADDQHSPSRWWAQFGLNDMLGWAQGFKKGKDDVISAQDSVLDAVKLNALAHDFMRQASVATASLQARMAPAYAAPAPSGSGGGGTINTTNLYQTIETAKALSPAELTREGEDFLAREKFKLH